MRITANIVGSLLVLAGATCFLQGINVLPGSFMTGQIRWAVYGGIAVAAGVGLLLSQPPAKKQGERIADILFSRVQDIGR